MPFISKLLKASAATAATAAASIAYLTKDSVFIPASISTSAVTSSPLYKTINPNQNPVLYDVCRRTVPASSIRPDLLAEPGALVRTFTAGIFGGPAYEIQRRVLARKYQSLDTIHQLWSTSALQSSSYKVGTQVTDHFEVVENEDDRIVVRCGDTPRNKGGESPAPRESDGLFEMVARREGELVVFELRSTFWNGVNKDAEGMPGWMVKLHMLYTKMWMEAGVRGLTV